MNWHVANLEVFWEWAEEKPQPQKTTIMHALLEAACSDTGTSLGEVASSGREPFKRVIRTALADIYFTTYGRAWNSAHDTLYLLDIVDT